MRFLLPAFLCLIALPALGRDLADVPKGLTVVDWAQIRAEHDRHRHTAFPDGAGFTARIREQELRARFDARGFELQPDGKDWRWGLELIEFNGRPIAGKAHVTTAKNRVAYRWNAAVEEWFVNEAQGVEHGFTIASRNSGSDELSLLLSVRGGLRAEGSGAAIRFLDRTGKAAINYSALKAWDAAGRALPTRMRAEGQTVRIVVDARGARYPVTIDPIAQQANLKPAAVGTTQAGDRFGWAVAVSGGTAVVGAPSEDSSTTGINTTPNEDATDAGAAFVYVGIGNTWTQQAYLKAGNVGTTQAGDNFGFAVGVSIADVIHSMALDQRRILPVSSLQSGAYGLRDVAISVPTVVGRKGVLGTVEIELWPKEKIALQNSAGVLKETISKVL